MFIRFYLPVVEAGALIASEKPVLPAAPPGNDITIKMDKCEKL